MIEQDLEKNQPRTPLVEEQEEAVLSENGSSRLTEYDNDWPMNEMLPQGSSSSDTLPDPGRVLQRHNTRGHLEAPLDTKKALSTGGLQFAPIYNETHNSERHTENHWIFAFMSVGLQVLTGIITGVAAFAVSWFSCFIEDKRLEITNHLHATNGFLSGWLISFAMMLGLALASALPVVLFVPTAGSSGIPAIIGILNGCDLRADFSIGKLLARLSGVTFAVASGLAVGPEGPMVFIGAATGALLSHIPSQPSVWRYFGRPPSGLNDHVYLRDYISTGAACGIAAAFRAPIAGTLFVVEEAASHFKREHLAKIFVAGLTGMAIAGLLASATGGSFLFEYKVATGDGCNTWQWMKAIELILIVIIGITCGLAGALFNYINVSISKLRVKCANPKMPVTRIFELSVICLLTSLYLNAMPYTVSERATSDREIFSFGTACMRTHWLFQIVGEGVVDNANPHLQYQPRPCFYGVQYNEHLCPWAHSLANTTETGSSYAKTCTTDLLRGSRLETYANKSSYCCSFTSVPMLAHGYFQVPANASCPINLGDGFPSLVGGDGSYNPMASLSLVSMERTAQNLMARGAPDLFPLPVLLAYLPGIFLLVAVTAGTAMPSGLLLPMIFIGAMIGRILAIILIRMKYALHLYTLDDGHSSQWTSEFQHFFPSMGGPLLESVPFATDGWLDPGVGALVGAGAFLGGCSRISLMVTVMMVEITGDPMMIAPVGIATLVAVIVGNRFNHGLYHALMDVASVPFLPDRWPKQIPKSLRVEHILRHSEGRTLDEGERGSRVVCLPFAASRQELEDALLGNDYSCFPVLDAEGVVQGVVYRDQLKKLLATLYIAQSGNDYSCLPVLDAAGAVQGVVYRDQLKKLLDIVFEEAETVDVGEVTDFNYLTIRPELPLEVAFNMFKRMEISHMIVVDNGHKPVAVMTRASLLPWHVGECIGADRMETVRSTIQRPRSLRSPDNDQVRATITGSSLAGSALDPSRHRAT